MFADYQEDGKAPVAPSAIRIENGKSFTYEGPKDFSMPHALTKGEIKELVQEFATAAKNAIAVGAQR